ncbi:MAG: carbon storage regulator CsrA [Phycisphaerae bacterium]|nr:carbon storage regulator CsrA [Phycisphaerae bacterium]
MLVLSRQKDETIMIGDDVEITVVDIRGDKVRLGITAPPHIPVHRKEVYEAIKRENRAASQVTPDDLSSLSSSGAASGSEGNGPSNGKSGANEPGSREQTRKGPRARRNGAAADQNSSQIENHSAKEPGRDGPRPEGT